MVRWKPRLRIHLWFMFAVYYIPVGLVIAIPILASTGIFLTSFPSTTALLATLASIIPIFALTYTGLVNYVWPIQIRSIAFEATSAEAMFEREMKEGRSYNPFYDPKFSLQQTSDYLRMIPLEIKNRSSRPLVARSLFLEVFRPLVSSPRVKYEKEPRRVTEFHISKNLPFELREKAITIVRIASGDLALIEWSNELMTKGIGRDGPMMRFVLDVQGRTFHGPTFEGGALMHFLNLMSNTKRQKVLAALVDEMIGRKASPSDICSAAIKLYQKEPMYSPEIAALFDLKDYLASAYPDRKEYTEEVQRMLSDFYRQFPIS